MAEELPDGTRQGYFNICPNCKKTIEVNMQGTPINHKCIEDHGICMESNCDKPATKDYNGHGHWVCDRHYDKLNDEFDEEYR